MVNPSIKPGDIYHRAQQDRIYFCLPINDSTIEIFREHWGNIKGEFEKLHKGAALIVFTFSKDKKIYENLKLYVEYNDEKCEKII